MNRTQLISIAIAFGLFGLLYFALDTKPSEHEAIEKSRTFSAEMTSGAVLIKEAKASLSAEALGEIELLEAQSQAPDTAGLSFMKQLAGKWYALERADISGYYAEAIAERENTEDAWAIAGTTFSICLKNQPNQAQEDFCKKRAIAAFENAISLNPENSQHQVNLAMVYANNPLPDQPMKGIQMLLEMNRKDPNDVLVLKTLARFGLQTNQFEKVLGRLLKAKALAPDDKDIDCLLQKAYTGLGQLDKADKHAAICHN